MDASADAAPPAPLEGGPRDSAREATIVGSCSDGCADLPLACASAGLLCGEPPPAGAYSLHLANKRNECDIETWGGDDTNQIVFEITEGSGRVRGYGDFVLNLFLDALYGGHEFNGTLDKQCLQLAIVGTSKFTQRGCEYYLDGTLTGWFTGTSACGQHTVRRVRQNDNPECTPYASCESVQEFSGSLIVPPKPDAAVGNGDAAL